MTQTNKGCLGSIFNLLGMQAKTRPTVRTSGIQSQTGPTTQNISADNDIDEVLPVSMPYRVRDNFLSPTELSFYHVLRGVVGDRAVVCPEMNLSSIFFVAKPNENQSFRARISQKSIDFLLCEPKTMKPVVGIELDDTSHARPDRQTRDEFVNKVFEAAELPLLRIPAQRAYTTNDLARQLEPFIGAMPVITPPAPVAASVKPLSEPSESSTLRNEN